MELTWINPEHQMPSANGEVDLLVIVSGQPSHDTVLNQAFEIAAYWGDGDWEIRSFPEWEGAQVHHWAYLHRPEDTP